MSKYQHVFFGVTIGLMVAIIVSLIVMGINDIQLCLGGLTLISALIYNSGGKGYKKS